MNEYTNVYFYSMELCGRSVMFCSQQIHLRVTMLTSSFMTPINILNENKENEFITDIITENLLSEIAFYACIRIILSE